MSALITKKQMPWLPGVLTAVAVLTGVTGQHQARGQYPVTVVVMRDTSDSSSSFHYKRTVAATNMAEELVKVIYRDYINFTFIYRDTPCTGDGTGALVADLHCEHTIGVFIGPGCSDALESLGPMSNSWNIPVITPTGSGLVNTKQQRLVTKLSPYRDHLVGDYPTSSTRADTDSCYRPSVLNSYDPNHVNLMSSFRDALHGDVDKSCDEFLCIYSVTSYVKALVAILKKYEWHNVAIIYDEDYTTSNMLKNGLTKTFGDSLLLVHTSYQFNSNGYSLEHLRSILMDASASSRVFIILCSSKESRELMLQAHALGYTTSGQYVFIIIEALYAAPDLTTWNKGMQNDQIFLKCLGHAIWPYIGTEKYVNANFTAEVVTRSLRDYGFDYNRTEPGPQLTAFYDAVTMYATVLNETLTDGQDPLNGTDLTRRLWNRTFAGINRPVQISPDGFRQSDVTFGAFDIETGRFNPVELYDYDLDVMEEVPDSYFDWPYNDGLPPANEPSCGYDGNLCQEADGPGTLVYIVSGLLTVLAVAGISGGAVLYRSWKKQYEKDLWWWKIASADLTLMSLNQCSSIYLKHTKISSRSSHYSQRDVGSMGDNSLSEKPGGTNLAMWKGQTVSLRFLSLRQLTLTRPILLEFKLLRDISHANLARIFGACLEDNMKILVIEQCIKGSLQDLIWNANINLDAQFKLSLSTDIINGLCYLHESPLRHHGRLTSNVCLIDNRFSVKLTDFGLPSMYRNLVVDVTSQEFQNECLWKAPELIRSHVLCDGTMEADIYSYGIILHELVSRDAPFAMEHAYMTTDEIIRKIQDGGKPPFRPSMELPANMSQLRELIDSCWAEDSTCRPSCQSVRSSMRRISGSLGDSGSLMDNLMRRMEQYANNLEKMVEEKTVELREEKKKSEELLYQILPRSVADQLKSGLRVEPQVYEGVSIYFSDIVGFTQISAVSSPIEVVDLLNDVYSCFDAIIEEFDVYKVETIGDAYMVVSGLPQRNGNLHALNIANMALKVLETIREFKIRHMPTESLKIRIGLHSGPACAGVVGLKMPRYCLFGDTVNTASRMESSGEAMMIHISSSIKELLDQFGNFHIIPRGTITVKGKGEMVTYWLLTSQRAASMLLPPTPPAIK